MNIVAIDAGRGHGTVSQTLEAAAQAAEEVGAQVKRICLTDYRIRDCVNCMLCALGEGCKVDDDLPELSEIIAAADGVILGAPESERGMRSGRAFNALLSRLRTYFEDSNQPYLPGLGPADVRPSSLAQATKRAIIITSASSASMGSIGAFFGSRNGKIRNLRQALADCHINAVGLMSVRQESRGEELSYTQWDKAHSLGRLLAGKL